MAERIEDWLDALTGQLRPDTSDDQVTEALARWGKVEVVRTTDENVHVWCVTPSDLWAFCEATEFQPSESKWGTINVVPHELHRIARLLDAA